MSGIVLEMKNVCKSFGGVLVLNNINFSVKQGEVHALLGHNGAGKSVLMQTLMGAHQPDSGEYIVRGKKVRFRSPAEAQRNRVSMVYQEFGLVNSLSVTENVLMKKLPIKNGRIDWRKARQICRELLDLIESKVSPDSIVGNIKVAEQQEVAIVRALSYDPVVFIMDEPTSALSYSDIQHLYKLVNMLRNKGVAIIYISHKLEEVFDLADRVTVIRDGSIVGTYQTQELNYESLVEKMTGKKVNIESSRTDCVTHCDEKILELKNVSVPGILNNINLEVGKGEIVGVAGVIGAGKTELAKVIFGALPNQTISGECIFRGNKLNLTTQSPSKSKKMGIGFVTEDRQAEGLVHEQPIFFNVILPAFHVITKASVILTGLAKNMVNRIIKEVIIRPPDPNKLVKFLSGGNQQKVVIGKWIATNASLLIMDEPTRGVDVAAREEIYEVIKNKAKEGLGVLLLSSDLREIMMVSDSIVVMRLGEIIKEISPSQISERELLHLTLGGERNGERDNQRNLNLDNSVLLNQ